ncbi:MAG: hypothetical protein OEX02_08860 [Cyclobacteriaceae bacterium]|nr:hypothetical protein [Cyclobacteriaceae bacterium]
MRLRTIIYVILLSLGATQLKAQQSETYQYSTEFIWGFNKNTTGGLIGGVVLRTSRKVADRFYESVGIEMVNIKHPREMRWNSVNTGNFFIYGKLNYLYAIRAQYGREYILFNKAADKGVEIKANAAAGPSFGLLNPYYVEVAFDPYGGESYKVPYGPSIPYSSIRGAGSLFQGLSDTKMKFGANIKASLSFELGTLKSHVTGFEAGFLVDGYLGEIDMMVNAENKSLFPTAFVTLFYGTRK